MTLPAASHGDTDLALAELFEEITQKLGAGEPFDLDAYVAEHPEYAAQLRELLPAVEFLVDLSDAGGPVRSSRPDASGTAPGDVPPGAASGTVGDFLIKREIGRGGMGVVYEAEQISLGRRVALKVLPFAAILDKTQLARFKNESRAAALLDHPNMVTVHSVGSERGIHYYAMQYIDGQTVAQVIADQRRGLELNSPAGERQRGEMPDHASPDRKRRHTGSSGEESTGQFVASTALKDTALTATGSTPSRKDQRARFRRVAELGIQAAEALEHAHQLGIVHRDIKPSNLMVDGEGHLWVTDLGLAMVEAEGNLTATGGMVGTLRYMSPEQMRGDRHVLDHRTDIYSLSATLYEMLTLRPAFPDSDAQRLVRRVPTEDPPLPRRLNLAIPQDLETIVLKGMSKEPRDRYHSAQGLADDLRRFLEDEPIRARRPSPTERVVKWSRRHAGALLFVVTVLAVTVLALGASGVLVLHERQLAKDASVEAQTHLVIAIRSVDRMLTRVGHDRLKHVPHMGEIRRQLLTDALEFYEGFLPEKGDVPALQYQTGKAHLRLAEIHQRLGYDAGAEEAYGRAITFFENLLANRHNTAGVDAIECQLALGKSHSGLALLFHQMGRLREAEGAYRRTIELCEQLPRNHPRFVPPHPTSWSCSSSWG